MEVFIRRRNPGLRVAAALLCSAAGFAGSASATSLQEAVSIAVTENPQVLTATHDREVAAAQLDAARGAYLPRVDLEGGYAQEQLDSPTSRLRRQRYDIFGHGEGSLSVRQTLFDGFGMQRQVDRSRAALLSSDYTVSGTAEQVALDTIAAYLDVLRRQRTVALAQDNVEGHRQIRNMIRLRVGAKVSRRSDLDQSDSRLALALANLRQEKGALTNAEATYRRLVGRAPEALEFSEAPMRQLPGVWGAVPTARVAAAATSVAEPASEAVAATADGEPALPVPRPAEADAADALFTALSSELADVEGHYGKAMLDTQQDAVKAALDRHPAVQAARQAVLSAQAGIGVAKATNYPTLSTELIHSEFKDTVRDTTKDTTLGLRLRWNLFNGGIDRANVAQAAARHDRALSEQQRIERQITDTLSQAGFDLLTIRDRRTSLGLYAASVARARLAYERQYSIGQRSLLDLVNTQDELFNARTAVSNAEFTESFAVYRVLQAMGRLLPTLDVPLPGPY